MSLFSTIQQSANALNVSQLGLHVVGNNIANANTPGYIRQELVQTPAAGLRFGDVILGYGVRAVGVVQKLDNFIVDRMRQTQSNLASSEVVSNIYSQMESIFGELSSNDLSSQLNAFSASVNDVMNQPGNDSLRRLVIERGRTLTNDIRSLDRQLGDISANLNQEVRDTANQINRLTDRIAVLNHRIVSMEGGRTSGSDAVGLRDERLQALQELATFVDIRAVEQARGSVTVFVGGEYLVADGIQRKVAFALRAEGNATIPEIRLADTDSPLQVSAGKLAGLYAARDSAVGGTREGLDRFARNLVEQFNRIHTQGQGLAGFSQLTGAAATDDRTAALDLAGYPFPLENGQFEVQVLDQGTGLARTHTIRVKLTGGMDDTSLEDVRAQLQSISGLSAQITPEGRLRILADTHTLRFSFQNDSSGFLAAAGLNTFFTGDSAATIAINDIVAKDPQMFAASLTGIGSGTDNALRMAKAFDSPLTALAGRSLKESYEDLVVKMTQDINISSGISDGLRNYFKALEGQHLGISGVNLDEEAVKMIFYQRAFQANSRLIQASSEMLEVLVNL
jgi:flagellar hook-associated protein 1